MNVLKFLDRLEKYTAHIVDSSDDYAEAVERHRSFVALCAGMLNDALEKKFPSELSGLYCQNCGHEFALPTNKFISYVTIQCDNCHDEADFNRDESGDWE